MHIDKWVHIKSPGSFSKLHLLERTHSENLDGNGTRVWILNKPPSDWRLTLHRQAGVGDGELGLVGGEERSQGGAGTSLETELSTGLKDEAWR